MANSYKLAFMLFCCLWMLPMALQATEHDHDHGPAPVQFVENLGQWPDQVLFRTGVIGATAFMEREGITWVKFEDGTSERVHDIAELSAEERAAFMVKGHAWRIHFVDPQADLDIQPQEVQAGYHNYFLGNDPSKWTSNVHMYGKVFYSGVWPGIDVEYYSHEGHMKYDIQIRSGADPSAIGMRYEGVDHIEVDREGRLVVRTSVGEVLEMAPLAFYTDGAREPITCNYVLVDGVLRYELDPSFDRSRPVTIDPLLIASTYSGATGSDNYGHCATFDDAGNIYTGARNFGPTYPVTVGAFQSTMGGGGTDISLSKLDPDGSELLWASYLGGNSGENPHSLVVNSQGHLCVFGTTDSPDFPTTTNAYDQTHNGSTDIIVTVVNSTGTALIGSTYIGGSTVDGYNSVYANYGEQYRGEIITDAADNILIATCSGSTDFPTTAGVFQATKSGVQDAVVLKLDPSVSDLVFSTFLGGTNDDAGMGIRSVDGSIIVCGYTMSSDLPTTAGSYQPSFQGDTDGFVAKFDLDGTTLQASTFFGTSASDRAYFIDHDLAGSIWIYGQTEGDIPIQPAGTWGEANGTIFIAKLDPSLATAPITTVMGAMDWGTAFAPVAFLVDVCDNIYISGYNSNDALPLTTDALYTFGSFYLAAFEADMTELLFATYYGGSHVDGGTSRFDKDGVIYQGVCSGGQSMQTTPWAYAPTNQVWWDVGVFKIDFQVAGVNAAGASTLNSGCAPIEIGFQNASTGDSWIWDFGDGSPPVEAFEPSHTYTEAGDYIVTLIAMDSLACNMADTTYLPITIGQAQPITANFTLSQEICEEGVVVTNNTSTGEPLSFTWDMGDGTQYNDSNATHEYADPGVYEVMLIAYDPTACSTSDTLIQSVTIPEQYSVVADFSVIQQPGCDELTVITQNQTNGITPEYNWDMGDGTVLTDENITHVYSAIGSYTITLSVTDSAACNSSDEMSMVVEVIQSVPVNADFTADQVFDCEDMLLTTQNNSTGTNLQFDWQLSDGSQYNDQDIEHVFSGAGTYTITLTVSDSIGCSPPSTVSQEVVIDPIVPVVADLEVAQVGNCALLTVETTDLSTGDSISLSWDMGDGTIYTGEVPIHTYDTPGTYSITLTVTDLGCGNDDQMTVPVEMISELPVVLLGDTVVCPGDSATLVVGGSPGDIAWSNGAATPSITVAHPGSYTVTVTTDVCQGSATVDVIAGQELELAYEVEACPDALVDLSVPIEGLEYSWSTGGNARVESVRGAGEYVFSVIDLLGCPHTDTVTVIALDQEPQLFAPNAFSPNGDGVNEEFKVVGFGEKDVELIVFDRWGERLWETNSADDGWDGIYNGVPVKNGVYVYRLKYTGICNSEDREIFGHVTVIR